MIGYRFCAWMLAMYLLAAPLWAGDWPQFRHDASRTAATPHALPAELELRWTRTMPAPRPAFPQEYRLAYDTSYEPVVLGKTIFVPSMVTDSVTALDTDTGQVRWRYITGGPVRFAPVAWEDQLFVVSDDGYLYCLDAAEGSLRWRFRGLPEAQPYRRVLGDGRMISLFAARGGPVLADGIVYFAAGLWPTEGVFVHALDARTGEVVWSNTDSDHIPRSNWDHGVGFHSGLTPQGYLAIVQDQLVVPCGAQLPAFLDLQTGALHTYTMGWGGRNGLPKGCWFVAGIDHYLSHGGDLFDISRPNEERFPDTAPDDQDYKHLLYPGAYTRLDIERANQRELDTFRKPVFTPGVMYESDRGILARDLTEVDLVRRTAANIPGHRENDTYPDMWGGEFNELWQFDSDLELHIRAGTRLYLGGPGVVEALETAGETPQVVWRAEFDGTPNRMLAADDKLFLVTAEGTLLAFGAATDADVIRHPCQAVVGMEDAAATAAATAILAATDVRDGYALVLGIDGGQLIEALARQSELQIIAVDEAPERVAALRERLYDQGLYGQRVTVLAGDPLSYPLPPYFASLVVTETPEALELADERALAEAVYHTLRPYGGVAVAWGPLADRARIEQLVANEAFPGAAIRQAGEFVLLARQGSLPGAGDWSHSQADAANSGAAQDDFIRSPMSLLWFDASQRWHKFPGQAEVRFAGGRMILLDEAALQALDVYTGRELWELDVTVDLEPLDDPAARDAVRRTRHLQWGPSPTLPPTTELVAVEDALYLSQDTLCRVLDPATGQVVRQIELPEGLETPWSRLRVQGDYLLGTSGPHLLCFDRHTGQLQWRLEADRTALSLAVSGERVFLAELAHVRRGEDEATDGSTRALQLETGELLWQRPGGTALRYHQELDLLVTAIGFYNANDGQPINVTGERRFIVQGGGLPEAGRTGYLAGEGIVTGSDDTLEVYAVPAGEAVGDSLKWFRRGCTGTRASRHLVTTRYRSNSAWIDLASREITPMLGIRPGCRNNNNLYPANGVLNMPNLTAGCTCNFFPTSMAAARADAIRWQSAE